MSAYPKCDFCGECIECARMNIPEHYRVYLQPLEAAVRAEVLREAAELGRELSRQGYSAQEIAKKLDGMADGGAA